MGMILLEYSRPKIARNRYNYLRRRTKYRSAGGGNSDSTYYTEGTNIGDYVTNSELNNILLNYLLKIDASNLYLTNLDTSFYLGHFVTTDLLYSEYYNKADIDIRFAKLAGNESGEINLDAYMLKSDFKNDYYSKEEIDALLANLSVGSISENIIENFTEILANDYVKYSEINEYIQRIGADKDYVDEKYSDILEKGYITELELLEYLNDLTGIDTNFLRKSEADNLYLEKGDYVTWNQLPDLLTGEGQYVNIANYISRAEAEQNFMKKQDLTEYFYLKNEVDLLKDNLYDYINENFAIGAKVGDSSPIYTDASMLINLDEAFDYYLDSSDFILNLIDSSVWNEYINSSYFVNSSAGLDVSSLENYLIENNYKKIILISLEDYDALDDVENDVVYLIDGLYCTCNGSTGEGTGDALDETKLITFLLNNNYKKIILISLDDYDDLDIKDPDTVYLIDGQICTCGEGTGGQGAPDLTNYYTKAEVDALIPDEPDLSNYVTINSSNNHKHSQYIDKSSTDPQIMQAHFQLGDLNTTAFKLFAAWRKCDSNITGSKVNSASFYVNSDGTAAFFHKTMTDAGASAVADAILKFSWKGLEFAQGANGRTTATEFNKVITEKELNAVTGDILTVLNSLT